MKYCPKCGTENKEEAKFCKECGAILEPAGEAGMGKRLCPKCGGEIEEGDKFCCICGARIGELEMEMADAGERFVSYILDAIIVNIIGYALIIPLYLSGVEYGVTLFLSPLISMGYFTYFFGNGQTPGMKAVKIKLCGTDGTYPIGYERGFIRWIGMIISGLVVGLGFLWILIDENKQGWHDKIADTYVIKRGL